MPTIPTYKSKTPITRVYDKLAGVDFTSDSSLVQLNRSPDSVNMYKDYKSSLGQAIETRPGFTNLLKLNGEIFGIHFLKSTILKVLVHSGNKLYLWKNYPEQGTIKDMELLWNNMNLVKSRSFIYNNNLYINDGLNYIFYDGTEIKTVDSVSFVPTTTIARNPTGGGTIYQPVNLLQPKRKNSFLGNGTAKEFTLDTANLDSSSVFLMGATINGVEKKEGTDFSVNRITGIIMFNVAPPVPSTVGQDNVVITLSKTVNDYLMRIRKCLLSTIYDNRIFFSGNDKFPSALFHSQVNDPTYISDLSYYQDGSDNVPITALLRIGDSLMVIKLDDQQDAVAYYHTPFIYNETTTYPTKQGLAGIGCISNWGSTNFLDEPVFISKHGLESFTKLNLGLERSVEHKSSLVDGKLVNESDLQNVHLEEWNGYLMCLINGHIYLADNRQRYQSKSTGQIEYEWYYWDNIGDVSKKIEKQDFSGSNITLNDSTDNYIENFKLDGKSIQETSEMNRNICPSQFECWESGDYNSMDGNKIISAYRIRSKNLLKVQPNQIYYVNTFSENHYNFVFRIFDKGKKFLRSIGGIYDKFTIKLNNEEEYISVSMYDQILGESINYNTYKNDFERGIIKPFICLNSELNKDFINFVPNSPTPDFPSEIKSVGESGTLKLNIDNGTSIDSTLYQSQKITIDLKKNILSSFHKGVKDKLYLKGTHIYIDKKIDRYELTGDETISFQIINSITKCTINLPINHIDNSPQSLLCSHFEVTNTDKLNTCRFGTGVSKNTLVFFIDSSIANTVQAIKEFIKNKYNNRNPIKISYELAEPQIIDLGPVEQLKTFDGTTNIHVENALGTNLSGKYYKYGAGTIFNRATLLKEYDGELLFGTVNGAVSRFTPLHYNDNGRLIYCKWQTPSDDFGTENHVKTTNKRGGVATLKTLPNSVCKLKEVTDKIKEKEITRYVASGFSFEKFSFIDLSFTTKIKSFMMYKIKEKKWTQISLKFYSDEKDRPFGMFNATLEAFPGAYVKGGN